MSLFSFAEKLIDKLEGDDKLEYNYDYLPPLALADKSVRPSLAWGFKVSIKSLEIVINKIALAVNKDLQGFKDGMHDAIKLADEGEEIRAIIKVFDVLKDVADLHGEATDIKEALWEARRYLVGGDASAAVRMSNLIFAYVADVNDPDLPKGRPEKIEDYNKLFKTIDLPEISKTFQNNDEFANMRVAGANPLVIEQMTEIIPKFPVTEDIFKTVMGAEDSLKKALFEKRVYIVDYKILSGAVQGSYLDYQKYLLAPIAMFALPEGNISDKNLKPVAIQCGQIPGLDNPIFYPRSKDSNDEEKNNWAMAKTVVQIADGNFHEAVSHLGRTHLLVQPFVLATQNKLKENHPVRKILEPHFEGTCFINNSAATSLIASQGIIDKIMGASIDNSRVLAVIGAQSFQQDFNNSFLPETLAARKVDNRNELPYYPFRDQALMIWGAIKEWVGKYLATYYASDIEIEEDKYLQEWLAELTSHQGGRMKNIGQNGKIRTLVYLEDVLTMVIFTASAGHAAVNYPQSSIMGFAPAMPLAGYSPEPTKDPEKSWLDLLPPLDQALIQLNTGMLLGGVYYTQLGEYEKDYFKDNAVKQALKQFQYRLKEIETTIKKNDPAGTYPYLLPSRIPQSVNI